MLRSIQNRMIFSNIILSLPTYFCIYFLKHLILSFPFQSDAPISLNLQTTKNPPSTNLQTSKKIHYLPISKHSPFEAAAPTHSRENSLRYTAPYRKSRGRAISRNGLDPPITINCEINCFTSSRTLSDC